MPHSGGTSLTRTTKVDANPPSRCSRSTMALLMSIAFVAGALACWLLLNRTRNNTALPSNAAEAFTVLARHGSTLVPKQGIACEIAASTGKLKHWRLHRLLCAVVPWPRSTDAKQSYLRGRSTGELRVGVWRIQGLRGMGAISPFSVRPPLAGHYSRDACVH